MCNEHTAAWSFASSARKTSVATVQAMQRLPLGLRMDQIIPAGDVDLVTTDRAMAQAFSQVGRNLDLRANPYSNPRAACIAACMSGSAVTSGTTWR